MSRAIRSIPNSVKLIALFGFLLLYIPLLFMIIDSFRASPLGIGEARPWTLQWYQSVFSNESILVALRTSLWVGICTTFGATTLGTLAALSIERNRFPGRKWLETIVHIPIVMPEIVLGLALLIWFVFIKLTLGVFSIILAHITFSISYVIITIQARLSNFDSSLEEAARDLGATPIQVFKKVTFPLIWPGVLSGALMAFTISFDDFLITYFTAGVGSDTLPVKIYSMIKFGVSPEINALSAILLGATLVLVLIFFKPQKN